MAAVAPGKPRTEAIEAQNSKKSRREMPRCSSSSLRFRPITDSSPAGRPRGGAEARRLPRRVPKATARDGVPVRRNVTVVGTRDAIIASRDRTLPPNSTSRGSSSKTPRAASTLPARGRGRSRHRSQRRRVIFCFQMVIFYLQNNFFTNAGAPVTMLTLKPPPS